ncbi:MAG: hypothetical protein KDM81_15855, partial [Verrucomicrobiae bacterium]|nr:hypothetical protein [Verrucomicrobiae bacterium]
MMRTRRRRYLILTAILIALPLLYLVEERVRGEWLLARTRRELSAGGEKLTINELLPRVPEGTNVVLLTPDQARSQFNLGSRTGDEVPATARMLSPGRAVVSWQRDRWLDKEAKAYTWDDFARATAGRLEQLPELRSQLTNQVLHVTLNYSEGWTLLLPHLAAFKGACQALCQAAVYDLHQGDLAPALDNLHAVARLTDLLRNEPLMIDQLVRVAIAAIARGTIWEALQADGWTDDQLVLLQSDWAGMHFTPAMVHALRMERAMNLTYFPGGANFSRNSIRQALGWGSGAFGGGSGGTPVGGGGVGQWIDALGLMIEPLTVLARIELWRHVWAPLDQRFYLEANQEIIDFGSDALARTNLGLLPNLEERGTNLIGGRLLLRRLTDEPALRQRFLASGLFAVANAKALGKCAQADAWNRVLVTAIALKRFHLKHGRPPEQLGELVPAFLPEIPIDWMDGEPLRYRLNPDSTWLLYSVGEDGNDDGGDAECPRQTNPSWTLARDYV